MRGLLLSKCVTFRFKHDIKRCCNRYKGCIFGLIRKDEKIIENGFLNFFVF